MDKEKEDILFDPDYPYKKEDITVDMSEKGYPIIERTYNALLYPEGPKEGADIEKEQE